MNAMERERLEQANFISAASSAATVGSNSGLRLHAMWHRSPNINWSTSSSVITFSDSPAEYYLLSRLVDLETDWPRLDPAGLPGTSSARPVEQNAPPAVATARQLGELRRLSGLTWDQLAELFGVSRRSIHFWASGKPLNAENELRLTQTLDVVRAMYRSDARSTRSALLEMRSGNSVFHLLVAGHYAEARKFTGDGRQIPPVALVPLDATAAVDRKPPSPTSLVDARNDQVHRDPGGARPARTFRVE